MNEIDLTSIDTTSTGVLLDQTLYSGIEFSTSFLVIYYSFIIILMLLMGWGLYLINKKLGEKHAWLSFFPILQYYSLCKAGQKSLIKYIIMPWVVYLVLAILLGVFAAMQNLIGLAIVGILLIPSYIYLLIAYIIILHGISKRTGRGGWTTTGLFLIPFIMFPVVGLKLKDSDIKSVEETPINL